MRLVGILGGTFNPIHYGHLRMAQQLATGLGMEEVRFIPSASPPHKDNVTVSAEHRAAMVELAIVDNPLFTLDKCELERQGNSYTIDTLISLRNALGKETSLCLMMGSDAFVQLDTWHRWQELLDYAHIILVQRPDQTKQQPPLTKALQTVLEAHYTEQISDLSKGNSGLINMQEISVQDISATQIRDAIKHRQSVKYLLPDEVIAYIQRHRLYQ
ncbi:MAG TPA: nicotinate-nucleotide adenylyltransferase [Methylophilaceae bacterium]|nr:nicotinate-nucleotide adenylyltransferase [Methylophilaceae bacterium]